MCTQENLLQISNFTKKPFADLLFWMWSNELMYRNKLFRKHFFLFSSLKTWDNKTGLGFPHNNFWREFLISDQCGIGLTLADDNLQNTTVQAVVLCCHNKITTNYSCSGSTTRKYKSAPCSKNCQNWPLRSCYVVSDPIFDNPAATKSTVFDMTKKIHSLNL